MRCSYCGGLNPDRASFCAHCGRDLSVKTAATPPAQNTRRQNQPQPPEQPVYQPPYPPPPPPYPPPSPAVPPGGRPARPTSPAVTPQKAPGVPQAPISAAEPPAPFPPHTIEHLKQLEQGALSYTVLSEVAEVGHKKIISIMYGHCAPWQQVATLLKALREQAATNVDTTIVQGFFNKETNVYRFTNGYLQFDRNVRLGGQTQNRYQIETGNGFDADSLRIVVSE